MASVGLKHYNMLKFFRHIRKQLMEQNKIRTYPLYAIGKILLNLLTRICPVRDYLSVALIYAPQDLRAVRYDICRDIYSSLKHIAYLRHAGPYLHSGFYRYVVPNGTVLNREIYQSV